MTVEFSPSPAHAGQLVTVTATYLGPAINTRIVLTASGADQWGTQTGDGRALIWDIWLDNTAEGTLYINAEYSQDGSIIRAETGQVQVLKP